MQSQLSQNLVNFCCEFLQELLIRSHIKSLERLIDPISKYIVVGKKQLGWALFF